MFEHFIAKINVKKKLYPRDHSDISSSTLNWFSRFYFDSSTNFRLHFSFDLLVP